MYKYKLYYDGALLKDTMEFACYDMEEVFETEEEAREEAEIEIEYRVSEWEIDGAEYEMELFDIVIEEV